MDVECTELNTGPHDWRALHRLSAAAHTPTKEKRASRASAEDPLSDLYPLTQSEDLNKPVLVGCWHNPLWQGYVRRT